MIVIAIFIYLIIGLIFSEICVWQCGPAPSLFCYLGAIGMWPILMWVLIYCIATRPPKEKLYEHKALTCQMHELNEMIKVQREDGWEVESMDAHASVLFRKEV